MKFNDINEAYNLPDIFLIGAAKSGTTTLAALIEQHPRISMPRKEPGFMAYHGQPDEAVPSLIRDRQIRDLSEYKKLYASSHINEKICDASVATLSKYKNSIPNLQKFYGPRIKELKIIAILRQPVDRSFSHYMMMVRNGQEDLKFEKSIHPDIVQERLKFANGFDYLGNSMYFERIKAFKAVFPQLKIYLTEDLKDTENLAKSMFEYLGVQYPSDIDLEINLNPSGIPKRKNLLRALYSYSKTKERLKKILPDKWLREVVRQKSSIASRNLTKVRIDPGLRASLTEKYFRQDIEKLEHLLERDLSSWRS